MKKIGVIEILKLVVSVLICQFAGVIGSFFTTPSIPTWYATLNKPFFTPPSWLFAPIWITLYTLMGISAFLVWRKGMSHRNVRTASIVFAVQLILNVLWSAVFFGLRSLLGGLIAIVILWIAILFTILNFHKISRTAELLLIPYILWVSIAAALNFSVLILNP